MFDYRKVLPAGRVTYHTMILSM